MKEIHVNKSEWDSLGDAQRDAITRIISEHFGECRITGSEKITRSKELASEYSLKLNLEDGRCTARCNAIEARVVEACMQVEDLIGRWICIFAAHEIGNECRRNC